MYNRETSIEDLFKGERISVRTLNRLEENNFFDLGQICDYCGDDVKKMMNIKGIGLKVVYEIEEILKEMEGGYGGADSRCDKQDSSWSIDILNDAYSYALSISKEYTDIIEKIYSSAVSVHKKLLEIEDKKLTIRKEYPKDVNIKIRMFCLNYARKALALLSENEETKASTTYKKYIFAESILASYYAKFSLHEEALFISHRAMMQELMQITYEKLADKCLTVTGKNYIRKYLGTFDKIVPYFDKKENSFSEISERKTMYKTFGRLKSFCEHFKDKFLTYYKLSDYDATLELLRIKYPFLDSNQRNFMCEFMLKNGYMPLFYIILNYVRTSEDLRNQIISYSYGFYDSFCMKNSDIAEKVGRVSERVRQIKERGINLGEEKNEDYYDGNKKKLGIHIQEIINNENLSHYEELLCLPYITSDTPLYLKIKEQEHLNCGFRAFAKILIALNSEFSEWELKDELLLLKPMKSINVSKIKEKLEDICAQKYYKDLLIPYQKFIEVGEKSDEINCSFIKYIASHYYKLEVYEDGILMHQNDIDISEELYNILEKEKTSLSLERLFMVFKKKYPSHKYNDPKQLKPYLKNEKNKERISHIGRTSMYILKSSNQNKDTIRDLLRQLLRDSVKPMSISEIYTEVSKYYPNTNEKSITSSMKSAKNSYFMEFENGFWGLNGKVYPPIFKIKKGYKRENFSARMNSLKGFVERNHRFPTSVSIGHEESSLYRWYYNIKKGIVKLSDKEQEKFDAMIQSYEQYYYPQNATEEEFLNKCEKMEKFIRNHHSLPTLNKNEELYNWYYRAKRNYNSYTDQRRKYLEDLFDFIKSLGFKI